MFMFNMKSERRIVIISLYPCYYKLAGALLSKHPRLFLQSQNWSKVTTIEKQKKGRENSPVAQLLGNPVCPGSWVPGSSLSPAGFDSVYNIYQHVYFPTSVPQTESKAALSLKLFMCYKTFYPHRWCDWQYHTSELPKLVLVLVLYSWAFFL